MLASIRHLIDLRPGEGRLVLESALTLFGLIAAHTLLETARDTLFLARLPPSRLTLVYAALALLTVFISRFNARFVRNFGRRNALIFTLFAAAYGTIVMYLLPPSDAAYFGLYVWSGLLGSVLVVQFWMFAGQRFTVAQGKRLFGPLAAGGVLGAVVGASAALPLIRVMPVEGLLLGSAGLFLLTALGLTGVPTDRAGVPLAGTNAEPLSRGLGLFRDNPYLTRLALLVALSTATVLCTDYLFKSVVASQIAHEDLGEFFARYYAGLNTVALIVQIFMAQAIVRRGGVVASFLVLPALLLVGATGTLMTGGALLAVLATKAADGTLRHSLHRIAAELLWMPVPDAVRTKSKVFIDTVVVRGTQGLTAAVLLGISTVGLGTPPALAAMTGGLGLLWLVMGVRLRRPYLELFRRALASRASGPREAEHLDLNLNHVEVVLESLSSRDPVQATAALQLLASSGRARLIPALVLYHEADEVLLQALEVITTPDRSDWVPLAVRLLEHDHEHVRFAALRALARVGDQAAIEGRLLDISPAVRAHAAYWLAETSSEKPEDQAPVRSILEMTTQAGCQARVGLLDAIAAEGRDRWANVILEAVKDPDDDVVRAATRAMARVRDARFIPLLVDRLRFRAGRLAVREAIVQLGEPALEALEQALRSPETDRRVRRHVPRTLSRFGTQRAADILSEQMVFESNGRVRYKILRGLGRMLSEHPVRVDRRVVELQAKLNLHEHLRLGALWAPLSDSVPAALDQRRMHDLLTGLLKDKSNQALERAFRLLQLAHRQEDLQTAFRATASEDRRIRAQALEFLDALTLDAQVPEIRELLRLSADDLPWPERARRAAPFIGPGPRSAAAALEALVKDSDPTLASIAEHYWGMLQPVLPVAREPPEYRGHHAVE